VSFWYVTLLEKADEDVSEIIERMGGYLERASTGFNMAGPGEVVILICAGYVSHRHDGMNLSE
jgi:hypothetical protein